MPSEFSLSVVAPDREVLSQSVRGVTLPGELGYLGVLAGHEPMVVALKEGQVVVEDSSGRTSTVTIGGGFVEITGDRVTILADSAQTQA